MNFSINHPALFALVGAIIALVVAQSVFFLVRAYRRGLAIGMERKKLNGVIKGAILFTVAPAIGIFIGVITLSKKLGLALPWLRLSVIGSLTYELTAAENAAASVGASLSDSSKALGASEYVTVATVMTLGIVASLILAPLLSKKISGGVLKIRNKDEKWGNVFMSSLFMGMISAFLGIIVCGLGFVKTDAGITFNLASKDFIPLAVVFASALIMALCGLLMKKLNWKWMNDYALPISMVGSMALAIPITAWLA
ncbi:MAG: DUF5058 family protein [Clostridia bacterium]|nr:DUF5058 family protein [Clostridia bacterium]